MKNRISISQIKQNFLEKKLTSVDLINDLINKIEDSQKDLNSVVIRNYEEALEKAKISDERLKNNRGGLLEGIPFISKPVFCSKGVTTNMCSNIIKNFVPTYESSVTERLLKEGAILLASANMDEFAMGSSTVSGIYGPAYSNWVRSDGKRVIGGGSSGGSAIAVSAGLAPFSLGSDTGGSVRQPAALTGLIGMKGTYGRCPRYGMISFASSFDQAGVFTTNVEDNALIFNIIAGHDSRDSTCLNAPVDDYLKNINDGVKGLKIGIPKECYEFDEMNKEIKDSWDNVIQKLKESGAEIQEISLKNLRHGISIYYILASAEASSNFAKYDGIRYGSRIENAKNIEDLYVQNRYLGFGDEVKRRIFLGSYVLSSDFEFDYYKKAQQVRNIIYLDFQKAFESIDAILMPTTPDVARAGDEKVTVMQNYMGDILTVPVSVAGLPAISVPSGISSTGLPIGMQIVGNKLQESLLYKIAKQIENFKLMNKNIS
jgi:aspartyl-tRNA(Asn)/glutamyl-tRNA(Gln) amidotransferase subunit A